MTHTHILVSLYSIEALRFLHSECTSYCLTTLRSRKLFEFIIQICTNTKTTSQASIGTVIIKIDQLRRTLCKEQSEVISKTTDQLDHNCLQRPTRILKML